jgi:GrpB-like predicted nucleotidyltransferase (UPF0157 family)
MLIQAYNEDWERDFKRIKAILETQLPLNQIEIEHIGSTSVPGLAAKAIIDIDIVYHRPQTFQEIKAGLERLDYIHHGDQGIPCREVFKRNKQKKHHPILDSITHHLYVCPVDSLELQRHLAFRDFLRKDEKARIAYEKLKLQIAALTHQDKKAYAKLKESMAKDFIESIIEKAKAD